MKQKLEINSKKLKPPIFIGGEGRSGTRLLRSIIGNHKNIFEIERETYLFGKSSLKKNKLFKKLVQSNDIDTLALSVLTSMIYKKEVAYEKIINREFPEEIIKQFEEIKVLDEYKTIKNKFDCFNLCANYLTYKSGKLRWVEKTPSNIYNVDEILECYPDAKIIIIYRDPRAVCLSWQKKDKRKSILGTSLSWKKAVHEMTKLASKRNHSVYMLKYQDLVLSPENEIKKLCEFINEEYDSSMMGKVNVVNSHFDDAKNKSGFNTAAIDRWKKELTWNQKLLIDIATKKERKVLGYPDSEEKLSFSDLAPFLFYLVKEPVELMWKKLSKVLNNEV